MPPDAYAKRSIVESCLSIDVRVWNREGCLEVGRTFSWLWTLGGKPSGSIDVVPIGDAVVLLFRCRGSEKEKWRSIKQRVPIAWTKCSLRGAPPWFRCTVTKSIGCVQAYYKTPRMRGKCR
jgi:hypothetical protein